jgi:murein L,D-transpeptidase YafK
MVNRGLGCAFRPLRRAHRRDNHRAMQARGKPFAGSNLLIRRPNPVRSLFTAAAIAAAFALAGCKTEQVFQYSSNAKANAPIPAALLAEMEKKNMAKDSPMLIRLFKEEAELEVWKQDNSGRYALLKTYPICRWSGDLGPKIREGDRQAPEGFYAITPGLMNPNSQYYLAFNLGYPNAYDRSHDRTGAHLMVHGDCSSRGCYAMSDEQISEIFAMGRESFFAGQQSFQVQAYPFRMSAPNMAKHRNSPHFAFWKMLKQGNDNFEVTRMEPKVDVCERRYVFNAQTDSSQFNPKGKCPAIEAPQDVAEAVHDKQRRDELKIAELTARNSPTAPISSNRDGGMHPKFLAALKPTEVVDEKGKIRLVVENPQPGKLASVAYSPTVDQELRTPGAIEPEPVQVADVPLPRNAPQAKLGSKPEEPSFAQKLENFFRPAPKPAAETRVATAEPTGQAEQQPKNNGSLFSRMTTPRPKPAAAAEEPASEAPKKEGMIARASRSIGLRGSEKKEAAKDQPDTQPAAPGAIRQVDTSRTAPQNQPAPATTASTGSLMSGSQPIPQASSFDSRFSAFR